jgi:membrane-associated phospholipid phosphatase
MSRAQFAGHVLVEYRSASAVEGDPLALLDDLSTTADEKSMARLVPDARPARRVLDDMARALDAAGDIDWLKAGAVGTGLTLASSLLDKRAFRFASDHAQSGLLKRTTTIGNAIPFLALGAAGLAALDAADPALSRTGYASLEAGGTAFLAATALKYAVGRVRPDEGVSNRSFKPFSSLSGDSSFPSRHTMVAWAALTPFARAYDAPWLYGAAALTQLGRVASREHWLSDTVAGGLLGVLVGQVFDQSSRSPRRNEPRVSVNPSGVSLSWRF